MWNGWEKSFLRLNPSSSHLSAYSYLTSPHHKSDTPLLTRVEGVCPDLVQVWSAGVDIWSANAAGIAKVVLSTTDGGRVAGVAFGSYGADGSLV